MKNIIFLDWTLFDAKDQVNPFVQVLGYVVAFESFSMFLKKIFWWARPLRQTHVLNSFSIRTNAHV